MDNIQNTYQAPKDRGVKSMVYCGVCERFFKRGRINDFDNPCPTPDCIGKIVAVNRQLYELINFLNNSSDYSFDIDFDDKLLTVYLDDSVTVIPKALSWGEAVEKVKEESLF